MKREELTQLTLDIDTARAKVMGSKGQDYADLDILSNFKRVSELCDILSIAPKRSAADCALFLAVLKVDRWCNLRRRNESPANESIKDTIIDLHNYIDLAYACEQEAKP